MWGSLLGHLLAHEDDLHPRTFAAAWHKSGLDSKIEARHHLPSILATSGTFRSVGTLARLLSFV